MNSNVPKGNVMKNKITLFFIIFSTLSMAAALWQVREAASLEDRLLAIDRDTQAHRLAELSLPRLQAELRHLLATERAKMNDIAPLDQFSYPTPEEGRADFNRGFFLLFPGGGMITEEGEDAFRHELDGATAVTDTIRRKADNPSAPIFDPNKSSRSYDPHTHLPVFGVYQVKDIDSTSPLRQEGEPGSFFAWNYKNDLVYMRSVPTSQGQAAEGFLIDIEKLREHLLPLTEPGLGKPEIDFPQRGETPNIHPLPLVLRPGNEVSLPDNERRQEALRGTVISACLISLLSIILIFGLLAFYARLERRRSDFVSAVTHELRTPLTTFSLCTEMLRHGGLSAEKAAEYHETLYRESRRLGHLVENVLSFAKLTRGKMRGRQDRGACSVLLSDVFEKVCGRLRDAGFSTRYTIDPRTALLSLRTDLISVEQILTNLADNAVKYAESPSPSVTITVIQGHRVLYIRFMDNGPGVAAGMRHKLFRPFSRSAQSDAGSKPGVGLGLALSRDLARAIGGELVLERSDEKGTCFLLTLPLGE